MQVAATAMPIFEAPQWTVKVVTFLIVLGFISSVIRERTLQALEFAFEERSGSRSVLSMKINPGYDFMRDELRFVALLARLGLSA